MGGAARAPCPPPTAARASASGRRAPARSRSTAAAPARALEPQGHGVFAVELPGGAGADYAVRGRRRPAPRPLHALAARGPARPLARARHRRPSPGRTRAGSRPPCATRSSPSSTSARSARRARSRAPSRTCAGCASSASRPSRSCPWPSSPGATAGATTASTCPPPTRPTAARSASSASSTPPTPRASPSSWTSSITISARRASRRWRPSAPTSPESTRRRGGWRSTSTTRSPTPCASGSSSPPSSGCATSTSTASASTPSTPSSTRTRSTSLPPSPAASTRSNPRALVIAESGLNDPKVMRPRDRGGWGCDAAWADDFHHALRAALTGETDGWYDGVRGPRHAGQGVPPPARPRRRPTRPSAAAASAPRPTTSRPSASSSSPPTTTRSATAPSATVRPREAPPARRPAHLPVAVHADALPGRGVRRAGAVPVLLRPHRRGDRRRPRARGAGSEFAAFAVVRRADPRPAGPGDVRGAPSSRARASRTACATLVAAALRPARRACAAPRGRGGGRRPAPDRPPRPVPDPGQLRRGAAGRSTARCCSTAGDVRDGALVPLAGAVVR